ncbi:substrate-binding domain-containing protein [Desulfosarcina ovata]|nr:substrate-binding domain-containing protein [Desulfosarcina ovata]
MSCWNMPSLVFIVVMSLFFSLPGYSSAGNEKTVALVMKALSNPFFSKMEKGARIFAQENAIQFEVFGVDRETDIERQIGIVNNLISRGYGAIVIAPADSKKLVSICKKAIDRGIIVINIDNPLHKPTLDQQGISIPFVGSDNFAGAYMIGEYVKAKLDGMGRAIVIEGIRGVENADLRKKGFIEAVTAGSSIEIVASESANWHTDESLSLTADLLAKHPNIDAIFCANDSMALGAIQAIDLMGSLKKIVVAGYDNIDSVRTEIRNGRIHATIEQHPELMGEYGVHMAWQRLNGLSIPDNRSTPLDLVTYEHFGKKVAFSISTLRNPFFSIMIQGAKESADLFGMELIVLDAENQDAQQLTDMAETLNQKVDLLIVNPTNTSCITPGIEYANNEDTPVITVDRKAAGGTVLCHIESDNSQGGKKAAHFLAQKLGGKGRVIEMEGIPGTSAAHERGAGFNEALKQFVEIKIVHRENAHFDRQTAKAITLQILKKDQKVDGVFAHNDNMILGVIDAYEELGIKLPKAMIGFDAIPEALRSIRQGKLTATIAQKPQTMGTLAIETAARYFRGEKIKPLILVGISLVKN